VKRQHEAARSPCRREAAGEREDAARHDDDEREREGDEMDPRRCRRSRLRRARRDPQRRECRGVGQADPAQRGRRAEHGGDERVRGGRHRESAFPADAVVEDEAARIEAGDEAERQRGRAVCSAVSARRSERPRLRASQRPA
jgi:hypothetical protein